MPIFKLVSSKKDNYENVVRITCSNDNNILTADVHKIFYDVLVDSESKSFSLDLFDHKKDNDYDYCMNSIVIENEQNKLFLSGHGLLLLLENIDNNNTALANYSVDDNVICHFKLIE